MGWDYAIPVQEVGLIAGSLDPAKGHFYADGKLHVFDTVENQYVQGALASLAPRALEKARSEAFVQIDLRAEQARLAYLTPGAGQALTYQAKREEMERFFAGDGSGEYPFLSAEIGITGETLADVASEVRDADAAWRVIGVQIERLRMGAKLAVSKAPTIPLIGLIVSEIDWP